MASIYKWREGWRAQVRRAGQKPISKTFKTEREAKAWARGLEHQADKGHRIGSSSGTLASLIEHYEAAREESGRLIKKQSNELYLLRKLKKTLGHLKLSNLTTAEILSFCKARKKAGAGPYTINMELSKLNTVLTYTCSLLGVPYHNPIATARPTLHHFKLIGAQKKRDRRPSPDEWAKLLAHFKQYEAETERPLPMVDMVELAALIGLRRSETVRILWPDLDQERKVILVRDRKHPREKQGNNELVPLVGGALDIIMRQHRPVDSAADQRIFPYNAQSVTKLFTQACKDLGIEDLRLHDLRHEATSALFEAGWDIPEVAAVTGHKDWRNLKRYTNLDPAKIAKKPN